MGLKRGVEFMKALTFTGWVFFLIFVYLVVSNGSKVVSLVNALGGQIVKGTVVLQGRDVKGLTV